jgi:hypothetical protein
MVETEAFFYEDNSSCVTAKTMLPVVDEDLNTCVL